MPEQVSAFLTAIPSAATNPLALVAYLVTVLAWAVIAFRAKRNGALLGRLDALPEADRLEALKAEMGVLDVPAGMTPELFVKQRQSGMILYGVLALMAAVVVIVAIAFFDAGKVTGTIGLVP